MRKKLVFALLTLGAGGAAIAVTAQADSAAFRPLVALVAVAGESSPALPHQEIQLAQAAQTGAQAQQFPPGGRDMPPPDRTAPRTPPTAAERTAMRHDMCQDGYARSAAALAYLEARLDLTPAQEAAFMRWRDVRLAAARRRTSDCAAGPNPVGTGRGARNNAMSRPAPPSPVEQMAREETMLQQRLTDLQAERPALEALYNSLTPTQRRNFGRGDRMGMRTNMMFRRGPGAMAPEGPPPLAR